MAARRRLDVEMVRRGLASSRAKAAAAIEEGHVLVAGSIADKAARLVAPAEPIELREFPRFVSRGGLKLDAALDRFGVDVRGKPCLDAGASTGGFTDCLLQRGAATVTAVDVGKGQIDMRLRDDPRVTVLDGVNVRALAPDRIPETPEIVTADLSFISLATVATALVDCAGSGADFVVLVKPQFEAGRESVGRGGVIRDPGIHREVLESLLRRLEDAGLWAQAVMPSPIRGGEGNIEFLAHLRPDPPGLVDANDLDAAVDEAHGEDA